MLRLYLNRLGEAQQQVAVVSVLLLAQFNFARQAFGKGVGQSIEFVEDGDYSTLLRERFLGFAGVRDDYLRLLDVVVI
jgi:hypothetical protein